VPAFLITQRGPEIGRRYELTELQFTIGRGQDNDLVLADALVSRYHAVLRRDGEDIVVIDLGSTNPLVVNETVPEPGMPYRLQHRDVVTIGQSVFSFQNPPRTHQAVLPPSASEPRTMVASAEPWGAHSPAPPVAPAATPSPAKPSSTPAAPSPVAADSAPPPAGTPQPGVRPPSAEPATVVSRRSPGGQTPSEPPAPRQPPVQAEPDPLGERPTVIVRRSAPEPAGNPASSKDDSPGRTPSAEPPS
jgi:pSer/pThr/pTyr-binding forkhead associated (FHA) protein